MWKPLFNQATIITRFIIRRDQLRLPIWLISIISLTAIIVASFTSLYQTTLERQAMAETMKNPAMIAMVGPGYGFDNYTFGAMTGHMMLLFTAIAVAIMSILLTTRHTRGDEEAGQIELIRSLPVGRLANGTSTWIVMVGANILLAILTGVSLAVLGIVSIDLYGSLLYGAALGATGIFFTSITIFFAQISNSTRGTIGLSFAVLLIAYLLRAIGDINYEVLSLISPLGIILRTEVYVNNYWWPIYITVGLAIIISFVALYLNMIRDLGSGMLPTFSGKKHASRFLQSPFGLAFRLQRTGMIAWAVGMFVLGASYGSVFGDLEAFFTNNEMLTEFLSPIEGLSLTEQFLTLLMAIIAMICTIPPLLILLKISGEEKKNRTELLFSTAISRHQLLGSYLLLSLIVAFVMQFLSVLGLWLAASAVMEESISFMLLFKAAMVYLPAIGVMIGMAVVFVGLYPQLTNIVWLYLVYSFFVVYLGGLLQIPEWLSSLSPFGHIPQIPVEDMNIIQVILVSVVSIIFIIIGFVGYRKRDITG